MLYPSLPPRAAAVLIWWSTGNERAVVDRLRHCAEPSPATSAALAAWDSADRLAFVAAMVALGREIATDA